MATKWVDNEVYFGPDRRRGGMGKRWGDRRRMDDAAEPPPLGALLRRLRVHLLDMQTYDDRRRAMQLANLAMTAAEQRRLLACADAIRSAANQIGAGDAAAAEAWIMEAARLEAET